jgi:hypothetical protein
VVKEVDGPVEEWLVGVSAGIERQRIVL